MASLLSYALTNVADVKESLGIASSITTYDNLVIRKINQATRAIEGYCGRRFLLTAYIDEDYNGTDTDQLVLKQRPIVSITSLSNRDTTLNQADFDTVDSQLYFTDANAGILNLLFGASGRWSQWRVTYSAGYTTIPEDLAEACVALACFYFNNGDGSAVGVSRKKEGQREVSYANATQTFAGVMQTLGIDGIINSYANYPLATGD